MVGRHGTKRDDFIGSKQELDEHGLVYLGTQAYVPKL
jgi:hypothetical protein